MDMRLLLMGFINVGVVNFVFNKGLFSVIEFFCNFIKLIIRIGFQDFCILVEIGMFNFGCGDQEIFFNIGKVFVGVVFFIFDCKVMVIVC